MTCGDFVAFRWENTFNITDFGLEKLRDPEWFEGPTERGIQYFILTSLRDGGPTTAENLWRDYTYREGLGRGTRMRAHKRFEHALRVLRRFNHIEEV